MVFTDVVSDPVGQRETVGLTEIDRVIDRVPVTDPDTVEGLFDAIEAVALRLFVFCPEPVTLTVLATEGVA